MGKGDIPCDQDPIILSIFADHQEELARASEKHLLGQNSHDNLVSYQHNNLINSHHDNLVNSQSLTSVTT